MHDYFSINLNKNQLQSLNTLALAHIGDAVYELLIRGWLCAEGRVTSKNLHRETVSYVRAPAQAKAMERLLPLLTEEEEGVYRRGRNTHVRQIPQNATRGEYMHATGLEALFGYLYLTGQKDRINELFAVAIEEVDPDAT